MMMNKYFIKPTVSRSLLMNTVRHSSKLKTPMEKLPKDPRFLTSNQPPLLKKAIYSEDEKLNLWKSLDHFELNPTFAEYSREEQIKMQIGHLDTVQIDGVTKPKAIPNEIDPNEAPYNEIYADGIDENNYTKVHNLVEEEPQRWYWVERLMPKQIIKRDNFEPGKRYPSGIRVPAEVPDLPYFVARTRNHLLPVYKLIEREDEERVKTVIQKVEGDIWELEQEIRTRLEAKTQKRILTAVNEVRGELRFVGNHVFDVVDYLEQMGF